MVQFVRNTNPNAVAEVKLFNFIQTIFAGVEIENIQMEFNKPHPNTAFNVSKLLKQVMSLINLNISCFRSGSFSM